MSHRTLVTSAGTPINHWHKDQVYGELTDAQKASLQASYLAAYPGITPVEYTHLDHTTETLLPTNKYNCWGFTFNPRQCWISTGADVQSILNDNGTQVFPPNLRLGDVVCYRDSYGEITHTGRIWSLDASGQPALVQSKWGSVGEYLHPPLTVPSIYGTDLSYWRVTPISGRGDTWVRDCAADDRNPYPPCGAFWLSPDLWCSNSGGTTHENPVRGQPNQLWVRVRNADTLAVSGGQVRVYWSNPTGGMPHWEWHLIGTAPVNLPAGPGSEVVAGPVTWTPGLLEPEHCCLFAVVDTGDDPCAAATLDPIVWPFDIARDNNIIWKNVWIIEVAPSPPPPSPGPPPPLPGPTRPGPRPGPGPMPGGFTILDFVAGNPTRFKAPLEVRVRMRPVGPEELEGMGLDPRLASPDARRAEPGPRPEAGPRLEQAKRPPVLKASPGGPGLRAEVAPAEASPKERLWRVAGGPALSVGRDLVLTTPPVPPGKVARLELKVAPAGARPGDVFRVDLEQRTGGQVTGGGTYVIVVRE